MIPRRADRLTIVSHGHETVTALKYASMHPSNPGTLKMNPTIMVVEDEPAIQDLIKTDFEAVLRVVDGVRADGVTSDDRVELRYPATFFSLHRCVYVTWTTTTMEIRNASGDDCSRLIE